MKKIIALILAMLMMLSLAACGTQKTEPAAAAEPTEVAEPADTPITLKVSFAETQGDPKYDAMVAFKDYVEENSEGSITIEL